MEIHKTISSKKHNFIPTDTHLDFFRKALVFVNKFYQEDFDRIANTKFAELTPEEFFREYTWCVYTSGFNARVVSKMFPALQEIYSPLRDIFCKYESDNINIIDIVKRSLMICNNSRKVQSIVDMSFRSGAQIKKLSWGTYRDTKLNSPDKLKELPFIGPITCYHLARNIGLTHFVKPDVHMNRLAARWGFQNPVELCKSIQKEHDMPLGLIDLVLWYAASTFGSK